MPARSCRGARQHPRASATPAPKDLTSNPTAHTRERNATRKFCAVQGSSGVEIQHRKVPAQRAMLCNTNLPNPTALPFASIKTHAANPNSTSTLKLQSERAVIALLIRTRIWLYTLKSSVLHSRIVVLECVTSPTRIRKENAYLVWRTVTSSRHRTK